MKFWLTLANKRSKKRCNDSILPSKMICSTVKHACKESITEHLIKVKPSFLLLKILALSMQTCVHWRHVISVALITFSVSPTRILTVQENLLHETKERNGKLHLTIYQMVPQQNRQRNNPSTFRWRNWIQDSRSQVNFRRYWRRLNIFKSLYTYAEWHRRKKQSYPSWSGPHSAHQQQTSEISMGRGDQLLCGDFKRDNCPQSQSENCIWTNSW